MTIYPQLQKTELQAPMQKKAKVANRSLQVDNSADMALVYFFTRAEKPPSALDFPGIEDFRGVRVPIKLHVVEPSGLPNLIG